MEVYQWLLRRRDFSVAETGHFLFVNAGTQCPSFEGRLEFGSSLIPYGGDDSWVDDAVSAPHACLMAETLPEPSAQCEWCAYREAAAGAVAAAGK